MTCNEAEDRLDDYVDGALAESEFQEMELHIASCAACREQERRLRATNHSVIKLNHIVHHAAIGHHVQNWYSARSASNRRSMRTCR